ncbi:MAG TPA: nicotinate-nucleotide--dimethylbenzimidazole phosphoribosyltransferase, partial [Marinagarivorans sp.]|nr:nicotinate-nucleotide--dimethylbenzimidazole phosphoribosyltransferase [Marinagarivorans sp.]
MPTMIAPLDETLRPLIQAKIDNKTKPLGALGQLEALALQMCLVQQRLDPVINAPHLLVFAGDHGAAAQPGISAYPQTVTAQMVLNFLHGGAAINGFCAEAGLTLWVVDAGVNAELPAHPLLKAAKIAHGTEDYCQQAAMSAAQLELAFSRADALVAELAASGCNLLALGEMGIGNTASSALITQVLTGIALKDLVGPGTGLDKVGVAEKLRRLEAALNLHQLIQPSGERALQVFGGFEMAMLAGACLSAAARGMLVLVDGFIASAAVLAAVKINSNALAYCVFCHTSSEPGHRLLLD